MSESQRSRGAIPAWVPTGVLGQLGVIAATVVVAVSVLALLLVRLISTYAAALTQISQLPAGSAQATGLAAAASSSATGYIWGIVGLIAIGVTVIGVVSATMVRTLQVGTRQMNRALDELAAGNLTFAPRTGRRNEFSVMAHSLAKAQERMRSVLADVASTSTKVSDSSVDMAAVIQEVTAQAGAGATQVNGLAESTSAVTQAMQALSSATEQLSNSIGEIAKAAEGASSVAGEGMTVVAQTAGTVTQLGESSVEVGKIVSLITGIANQTNLLALNATIEAAGAGAAGKGFAVVAHEVKELARETSQASQEVAGRVDRMQTETTAAVEAIATISELMQQITAHQAQIAAAVQEQAASTAQMMAAVQGATGDVDAIATTTSASARGFVSAARRSADAEITAKDLAGHAERLNRLAATFVV